MKAIVIREPGKGVEAWQLVDRSVPKPGPGQVLVRMRAASLNYRDLMIAKGFYASPTREIVALCDGAGEVVDVGAGVTRWTNGDRVASTYYPTWHGGPLRADVDADMLGASGNDGVLAEYAVLSADGIVRIPAYLSFEAAATLPCAAVTAWSALIETPVRVAPGGSILVQGTGGVSLFAAQLARASGVRVIATSSSEAKRERLRELLGIADAIDYRATPAWHEPVLALTGGRGVDQVIEVGGADTLAESFLATREGGTISLIGILTGIGPTTNPLPILFRGLRVEGVRVGTTAAFEAMNRALETLRIQPIIDEVFPLDRARDALARLASGAHFGKVVVRID